MKRFVYIVAVGVLMLLNGSYIKAETGGGKTRLSGNVNLVSKHLWRGLHSGGTPSIEPTVSVTKGNLTVAGWGAWCYDGSYNEIDIYSIYTYKNFMVGVFDYFSPVNSTYREGFFDYSSKNTEHLVDIQFGYNGTKKWPVHFLFSSIVYGADKLPDSRKQRFSSYLETGYSYRWTRASVDVFAGATPGNSFYAEDFAFVNVGATYHYTLFNNKPYKLPVKVSVIGNPEQEKLHFLVGANLKLF